jgi:glutamate--cysteine ligase
MTATARTNWFAESVRTQLFAPSASEVRRVGAEVELIPVLAESNAVCPLLRPLAGDGRCSFDFIRQYGSDLGWEERRSAKGAPYFSLPQGARLTFEPGGQLELSSRPCESVSALLAEVRRVLLPLRAAAADTGIDLLAVGIDPHNDIQSVPLQLESERYCSMTTYFEQIGPSGVRMMRQTAAVQINLDGGDDPLRRWRLLSDLAPYLTALFANSSRYAGTETGWQSFRAYCWRTLDPSRTGVPHPHLPAVEAYTRFALDAPDMMRTADGTYRPFAYWAARGEGTSSWWETHLSTLFPEVRPRGHLEVRAIDALEPEWLGAPVVLLAGLAYDPLTAQAARELVPAADETLLLRAARCGVLDPQLANTARELVSLGLTGARRLGDEMVSGADLEDAEAFCALRLGHSSAPA